MGPNYILDKGFLTTGATAYARGEMVILTTDGTTIARATTANSRCIGVVMEDLEVAKVSTGKAVIDIRIMGIARCLVSGAVALNDRVANDVNARLVTKAQTAAGSQPTPVIGTALQASTTAGDMIDVLLTPGDTY
jgi:hypothetical protein